MDALQKDDDNVKQMRAISRVCHFPQKYFIFLSMETGPGMGFFWGIYSKMEKNMRISRSMELKRSKKQVVLRS